MKEKIRKDELDYLRRRKLTGELSRLADTLARDRQAWQEADWKTGEMVDEWWKQLVDERDAHQDWILDSLAKDKEKRVQVFDEIANTRQEFIDLHMKNTARHLNDVARSVRCVQELEGENDDAIFQEIEDEWLYRKEEMLKAREEVSKKERERIQRLVENMSGIGEPGQADADLLSRGVNLRGSPTVHLNLETRDVSRKVSFE